MDFPIFNGMWRGLSVRANYEPERMDVLVTITGAGVSLFSFRLTASQMEHAATELANLLAPLARALGDDFAEWWKRVAGHIRPVQAPPVAVGGIRIPERLLAGFGMRQIARTKSRPLPPPSEPVFVPAPAPAAEPAGLVAPDSSAFAADAPPAVIIPPPPEAPAPVASGATESPDDGAAERAALDTAASTASALRGRKAGKGKGKTKTKGKGKKK